MYARTWTPLLGAAAMALTIAGCQRYETKTDTTAIEATIKADEKQWSDEFQAKPRNLDTLVARYADDAYFVAPGVKPASGAAAIRAVYAEGLKDPNFNINFAADSVRVAGSGDMAVARGRFSQTYTEPATNLVRSTAGSFVTVYTKQPDGSWKVVEDWAVSDGADPKPAVPATRAKMIGL